MSTASTILDIDFTDSLGKDELQISERLIREYQDLNDKIEKTIIKIKNRKKSLQNT